MTGVQTCALPIFWSLGKKAVKGPLTAAAAVLILALYALGVHEIALLFGGGLAVMFLANLRRLRTQNICLALLPVGGLPLVSQLAASFSLATLFLTFLKIGAVLYGSGYVLIAFLRADFVLRLGWLTDQQLLDAVAVGQITTGPLFTTATFIGFFLGGLPGALLATLAIFLPSFVFVLIANPLIPRMRRSPWCSGLLDGVNVASLSLMAAVTGQLARASLIDARTVALAAVSLLLLLRFRINATWLILAGALIGLLAAQSPSP